METYDLHGLNLEESLAIIDRAVNHYRLQEKEGRLILVTGRGVMREKIFSYLESLGLEVEYQWGNDGAMVVTIT